MPGQACRTALKCEKYSDFNDKLFQMRKVTPPFIGWSERIVSSSCKNTSLSDVNLLINPSINTEEIFVYQIRSDQSQLHSSYLSRHFPFSQLPHFPQHGRLSSQTSLSPRKSWPHFDFNSVLLDVLIQDRGTLQNSLLDDGRFPINQDDISDLLCLPGQHLVENVFIIILQDNKVLVSEPSLPGPRHPDLL